MDSIIDFSNYFINNWPSFLGLIYDHILMVAADLVFALIFGVPLGVLCIRNKKIRNYCFVNGKHYSSYTKFGVASCPNACFWYRI